MIILSLIFNYRMDYQSNTKDRTLGWLFLQAADLVESGMDKDNAPFVAKGTVDTQANFTQNAGQDAKGTLYYTATFFPCSPMPGLTFEPPPSNEDHASIDTASIASVSDGHESDVVDHRMQNDLERIKKQARERDDPETSAPLISIEDESVSAENSVKPSPDGLPPATKTGPPAIPRETLLQTGRHVHAREYAPILTSVVQSESGVLAIDVVEGKVTKKGARLEILFDSAYWPSYSTEPGQSQILFSVPSD